MITTKNTEEIKSYLKALTNIEYRIINNTLGKNVILLDGDDLEKIKKYLMDNSSKYIQEIIIENEEEDSFIIEEIKRLCPKNSIIHRNISYINWNREVKEKFYNIIAGYSFKGGMGRSTTLAYLSYFYSLLGKKVAVLDCDFEAPGIASMFFTKEDREKKSGILDYFVDLNIEKNPTLENYHLKQNSLYLFPSGIDYNIKNYMNKISKIDFNSIEYTKKFTKLLDKINKKIRPDLIFIDLRAGINESNGLVLKHISNTNLMFFNSEEQNEDGLQVILNLFDNLDNNFIMNSTIRHPRPLERERKEKELTTFLIDKFKLNNDNIVPIQYKAEMLETDFQEFDKFVKSQNALYSVNKEIYIEKIIKTLNKKYFDREYILRKLKKHFSSLPEPTVRDNFSSLIIDEIDDELTKMILNIKDKNSSDAIKILFGRETKWILEKFNDNGIPYKKIYKFMTVVIEKELELKNYDSKNLFSIMAGRNYRKWNKIFTNVKNGEKRD
jgi:MinD-like ATPase involved in chromosome partitioning or flagellar assembly/translation initiation factor 1 (eIF-1/SUI1)